MPSNETRLPLPWISLLIFHLPSPEIVYNPSQVLLILHACPDCDGVQSDGVSLCQSNNKIHHSMKGVWKIPKRKKESWGDNTYMDTVPEKLLSEKGMRRYNINQSADKKDDENRVKKRTLSTS